MTEIISITLENEMDLILAYKKSIKMAELMGLALSTQTAFATAVSEVCREVIDKAFDGIVYLRVENDGARFWLIAKITFKEDDNLGTLREGFEYARKLVPVLEVETDGAIVSVSLKLGLPRSAKVDYKKVREVQQYFQEEGPINPYEEIKRRNKELFNQNAEREMALLHANYLNKQKDEFLSVASHELNTPLTVLTTLAQLALRANGDTNGKIHGFLKKIEIQSSKLKILIQQLLDISKIENGRADYNKEEVEVNDFLNNSVELIKHFVPQHKLSIQLDRSNVVLIDKLRMEQVINNLVSNAAKYSNPGTQIFVRTVSNHEGTVIYVEDQGIGMSEETIANLFNKFYRSEEVAYKYKGLGMGLYIANRIVADHSGEIKVESREGEGSIFSFGLPAVVKN